jgi:hypothetical protein
MDSDLCLENSLLGRIERRLQLATEPANAVIDVLVDLFWYSILATRI